MTMTGFWQPDRLHSLADEVDQVELKLVVPRTGSRSLGIDPDRGPTRRIYFLDTPDLALYRLGVIVRFRDRNRRRDDVVVKLRPVVPGRVPGWLRHADCFRMEIDALPDHSVCSGALKKRLARGEVSRAVTAGRPLTKLLSPRQRRLLVKYAPAVRLRDLTVFGPIHVRCQTFKLRGFDGGLTAERWRYPDGSDLVELSTRCPVDEAPAVAARMSTALQAYGVVPSDPQVTKTEIALSS